jgi:very-short-patch-repair endonuclease
MTQCACGKCGLEVKEGRKYKSGHNANRKGICGINSQNYKPEKHIRKLCNCGCNNLANEGNEYIIGHHLKNKLMSEGHNYKPELHNIEKKYCGCGCGAELKERSILRNFKFLAGHNTRKITELTRKKLSNKQKEVMKTDKAKIRRSKQVFPLKDTTIEIKIQQYLTELKIEYMTHKYIKEIEHGYQCDIFIPSMNLVIECDGNYWHKYPTRTDIDNIRTTELLQKGFKVLRLWEIDIRKMTLEELRLKILELK